MSVCDLPTGPGDAIQKVFQTFAHKHWVCGENIWQHAPGGGGRAAIRSYLRGATNFAMTIGSGRQAQLREKCRRLAEIQSGAQRVSWLASANKHLSDVRWIQ